MEKKDKITPIRWDADNWKYAQKIIKKYYKSPKYSFNRLINHLLRQHISTQKIEKSENLYYLKLDILDLAKQKEEIIQQLKEKAILYEMKKETKKIEEDISIE